MKEFPSLPAPRMPDDCAERLWKRIPGYLRLTFLSAVVLGFATHLYIFTNKLPNHDDIGHLFSADYGTASGRWLLPAVLKLDGAFSLSLPIGVLSVLCLAGVACFTVSLLRIRRPLSCFITAAVLVTFPSVAATFSYMFTADAYFFSLLLAVSGAWAAVRLPPWGSLLGAAAITLSMGIYQSYFGMAAALMVGALLFETLDGQSSFRTLFLRGLRLAATLGAAVAAYMLLVRCTTRNVPLVDYMGISDMGHLSLGDLPHLVYQAYGQYVNFFLLQDLGYHFGFLKYALVLTGLCTVLLGVLVLREKRLGTARTLLAAALAAVYPLAGNIIYVMVPGGNVHTLMLYGFTAILIAPVALADYSGLGQGRREPFLRAGCGWVVALSIALTAYSYFIADNTAYLKLDLSLRQCTAYSTRLLERIETCEGYQPGTPVVLVGSDQADDTLYPTPQLDRIQMIGVFDMAAYRTAYTYDLFLRDYLGFTGEVSLGDSEEALALGRTAAVRSMPLYPAAGSVRLVNGAVVVKLNEPTG